MGLQVPFAPYLFFFPFFFFPLDLHLTSYLDERLRSIKLKKQHKVKHLNALTAVSALMTLCLTPDDFTRQCGTPWQ